MVFACETPRFCLLTMSKWAHLGPSFFKGGKTALLLHWLHVWLLSLPRWLWRSRIVFLVVLNMDHEYFSGWHLSRGFLSFFGESQHMRSLYLFLIFDFCLKGQSFAHRRLLRFSYVGRLCPLVLTVCTARRVDWVEALNNWALGTIKKRRDCIFSLVT